MKANDVKNILSDNDILSLLEELGADPQAQGNHIFCRTICHHGNKKKLVYFKDSRSFKCFTDSCGSMDIFGLVSKVMDLDFYSSFKYVCMKFGISMDYDSFSSNDSVDTSFINKFKEDESIPVLDVLNEKILNSYHDFYHQSWIDDGISIRSMKRFGIKYSILNNQIIIPHYDLEGNLIGVRARNLNEDAVESGRKYMPVYWKRQFLKHPTGAALYGLNFTREQVEKYHTLILFESEKSVLQLDTMFPDMSIGACLSGSSMTLAQLEIIKTLDVSEVIISLDKEFEEVGSDEEKFYAEKIKSVFLDKLSPYFRTSVIWDLNKRLNLKDSPTDQGLETFNSLMEERIII